MLSPHSITDSRDRAALAEYLWRIRGVAPLTWEEEQATLSQSRPIGRVRLIASNLRQVADLARRYAGRGTPLSELIQAGNAGLLRAAEEFDASMGVRFSTHAAWWIKHSIRSVLPGLPAAMRDRTPGAAPQEATVPLREMAAVAAMLEGPLPRRRPRPSPAGQPGRSAERAAHEPLAAARRAPGQSSPWDPRD